MSSATGNLYGFWLNFLMYVSVTERRCVSASFLRYTYIWDEQQVLSLYTHTHKYFLENILKKRQAVWPCWTPVKYTYNSTHVFSFSIKNIIINLMYCYMFNTGYVYLRGKFKIMRCSQWYTMYTPPHTHIHTGIVNKLIQFNSLINR